MLLLFVLLGLIEAAARLLPGPLPWKNGGFQTATLDGDCVSHDPGDYYPLDLRSSQRDRQWLLEQLNRDPFGEAGEGPRPESLVADLARMTPHCLTRPNGARGSAHPGRARRVAVVGDSFTAGMGLKLQDTTPHLLGQRLTGIDFVNKGKVAADIREVFQLVYDAVTGPEQFKRVVYFFNPNDPAGLSLSFLHPGPFVPHAEALDVRQADLALVRFLAGSRVVQLAYGAHVRWQFSRRFLAACSAFYLGAGGKDRMAPTRRLLVKMKEIADQKGARLLLVIYPLLIHGPLGGYPLAEVHDWVMKTCKEVGLRCLDGHEAFSWRRSLVGLWVNPADAHPNGAANQMMVRYLVRAAPDFFEPVSTGSP